MANFAAARRAVFERLKELFLQVPESLRLRPYPTILSFMVFRVI